MPGAEQFVVEDAATSKLRSGLGAPKSSARLQFTVRDDSNPQLTPGRAPLAAPGITVITHSDSHSLQTSISDTDNPSNRRHDPPKTSSPRSHHSRHIDAQNLHPRPPPSNSPPSGPQTHPIHPRPHHLPLRHRSRPLRPCRKDTLLGRPLHSFLTTTQRPRHRACPLTKIPPLLARKVPQWRVRHRRRLQARFGWDCEFAVS